MKIDKFGLYKKMRQATPNSGIPRRPERLIGKTVSFLAGSFEPVVTGIVENLSLGKDYVDIDTNISWVKELRWRNEYGWHIYSTIRADIDFDIVKLKEIQFQKGVTWYLTWFWRKIFGWLFK